MSQTEYVHSVNNLIAWDMNISNFKILTQTMSYENTPSIQIVS